ncbi:MAG TPA: PAS domain-containing protein [Rhizomicrobium sp.]|nr:PAS domain-containing protein [Rhizomicrobium sp.]
MSLERFEHSIESLALRNVVRHWAEARGGRRMPGWDNLNPAAIKAQLAIIWSWRFDPVSRQFIGRLAGERIESVLGMSVRGTPMSEVFARHDYAMALARHTRVVTEPAFYRGHGLVFRHLDRFDIGERIILPLADDGEHADGIIGATEFHSNYGTPPKDVERGAEIEEWFTLA